MKALKNSARKMEKELFTLKMEDAMMVHGRMITCMAMVFFFIALVN